MPLFHRHTNADKRGEIRVQPVTRYNAAEYKIGQPLISQPLEVIISEGKKFYDILCFQDPHNFAVSDRIHNLLLQEGITGWHSYPLAIEGSDEKYWGIQVTGRAGPPFRPHVGFIDGLMFDFNTWDGSDMFVLEGTVSTLFSDRLRQLLQKAKTSNLALDEISTIRWYSATADSPD